MKISKFFLYNFIFILFVGPLYAFGRIILQIGLSELKARLPQSSILSVNTNSDLDLNINWKC